MFSNASCVATAFSSSSLSVAASADTSSAVLLHLSTPRFVAKSPSLLKANQGAADATTIRGPVPPCTFTLRGKGRTREQDLGSEGRAATATAMAKTNPRRVIRVDTGEGYSPRLRMMNGGRFTKGDKATTTTTTTSAAISRSAPVAEQAPTILSAEPSHSAVAFTSLNDATCGAVRQVVFYDTTAVTPSFSRRDEDDTGQRDSPPDGAPDITKSKTWSSRESAKIPGLLPQQTREQARTTSREGCLCGRLCTGTTAALRSDATRPRILFLVSGQHQSSKKEEATLRKKHSGTRSRHHERPRVGEAPLVVSLPPPVSARSCDRRGKRARSGGWRRARVSSKRVEGTGACRDEYSSPRSPVESEGGDSYDVETTAATDGKGGDSARRVVHVRVPPTPLLVFRSVLPTVEQT